MNQFLDFETVGKILRMGQIFHVTFQKKIKKTFTDTFTPLCSVFFLLSFKVGVQESVQKKRHVVQNHTCKKKTLVKVRSVMNGQAL